MRYSSVSFTDKKGTSTLLHTFATPKDRAETIAAGKILVANEYGTPVSSLTTAKATDGILGVLSGGVLLGWLEMEETHDSN